ncbi:unnamed protein product [Linum trigynum]|uniref:Uncharacterized protein n=1 Tax=Linum trigynum TaxID=586398 RepID=A0AAV2CNI0_9ROSI
MGFELHDGMYVRAYNPHVVHDGDDDVVDDGEEPRDEPMWQPQSSVPPVTLDRIWERMDDMYEYMRQMSTQMTGINDYMGQMTTQMSSLQATVNDMRDEFRSFSGRYMHPPISDYHNATNEENADE